MGEVHPRSLQSTCAYGYLFRKDKRNFSLTAQCPTSSVRVTFFLYYDYCHWSIVKEPELHLWFITTRFSQVSQKNRWSEHRCLKIDRIQSERQICMSPGKRREWRGNIFECFSFTISMSKFEYVCSLWWLQLHSWRIGRLLEIDFRVFA